MKVLISGASIAGPALAYWLERCGHTVTVVERAAEVRPGGQAVDFKGETHRKVLQRLGILDDLERLRTATSDLVIIDDDEKQLAVIPGEFSGGDIEVLRGDLGALLYERTADSCEYIFGDTITSLRDTGPGVDVTFEHAAPRTFDMVVGADGIHSTVRRLAFGPESDFVRHLGYYYAVVGRRDNSAIGQRQTGLMYNEPGRLAVAGGSKAPSLFVFASPQLDFDRYDVTAQKQILERKYRGARWQVPQMVTEAMAEPDFYLDSIGRVHMDGFTTGRIALVGDAAYGNTLGGFGTGLAIVGAYVLAGELAAADDDIAGAFARYDEVMRRYSKVARSGNAGPFLAPPSKFRMAVRNWTFRFKPTYRMMMWLTDRFATDIELHDYPLP